MSERRTKATNWRHVRCHCGWEKCREFHKAFHEANDSVFGERCWSLECGKQVGEEGTNDHCLAEEICRVLNISQEKKEKILTSKKRTINIARHHFTRLQMTSMSKHRLRRPATIQAIEKLGATAELTFRDRDLYFHLPNRTVEQVQSELDNLETNREEAARQEAARQEEEQQEAIRQEEERQAKEKQAAEETQAQIKSADDEYKKELERLRQLRENQIKEEQARQELIRQQQQQAIDDANHLRMLEEEECRRIEREAREVIVRQQRLEAMEREREKQIADAAAREADRICQEAYAQEQARIARLYYAIGEKERTIKAKLSRSSLDDLYRLHVERDEYKENVDKLQEQLDAAKKKIASLQRKVARHNRSKRNRN